MNVERLFTVAKAIADDLNKTTIISILNSIKSSLTTIVSQPNNGTYLKQLSTFLSQLKIKASESELNKFPPLWELTLKELGFYPFGDKLYEKVSLIIQENQLTVPVAQKEIAEIVTRFSTNKQALDQMITSFTTLEIGSEELAHGDCELGILVPRKFVDNDLIKLSEEFENISEIFSVFEEVVLGTRSGFKVKSISSSEFGLYIAVAAPVALVIVQAVDKLMSAYKQYWEIKKIKADLEEKNGVPPSKLDGLTEHIANIVKESIDSSISEIIGGATAKLDSGRKNELKTELKLSLHKLANRLDRGFNIEVRINPPDLEALEDEEDSSLTSAAEVELFNKIKSYSENFSYIEQDQDPVIFLTEDLDELKNSDKKAQKKTTKKSTKKT